MTESPSAAGVRRDQGPLSRGRRHAARWARGGKGQAKAALQQARTALGYTHIVAPFDGLVTEKKADVGTLASPGMPIFTVEDSRRYRLEATVNETDLRYVRQGQQMSVSIDALGDREAKGKSSKSSLQQTPLAAVSL